jgi:hypothetical protein
MCHEEQLRKIEQQNPKYRVNSCDLTFKQILCVLCPSCGGIAGESCELHAGDLGGHSHPA